MVTEVHLQMGLLSQMLIFGRNELVVVTAVVSFCLSLLLLTSTAIVIVAVIVSVIISFTVLYCYCYCC